jgi:Flp pilus assembly pilin Flp
VTQKNSLWRLPLASTRRYLSRDLQLIFINQGEGAPVDFLRHLYISIRESIRESSRGQSMTEYALILAAVAVVVYAGYQSLGTHVNSSVSAVDNLL